MRSVGIVASWLAVACAAWACAAALASPTGRPALRDSATRALWIVALGAATSAVALGALLRDAELVVSYVARHVSLNLPPALRVAALWGGPAGTVLPAAAVVAATGGVIGVTRRSTFGLAVAAATSMALLASSIAAMPFDTIAWTPAEGLGLPAELREVAAIAARVILALAIAAAVAAASIAADAVVEGEGALPRGYRQAHHVGAALLLVAIVATGEGGYAAGVLVSPAPFGGLAAALLLPLLAAIGASVAGRGSPLTALVASVGAVAALLATMLVDGLATSPLSLRALAVAGVLAAVGGGAVGLLRPAPLPHSTSADWSMRAARWAFAIALASALLATIGERISVTTVARLTSGATMDVVRRIAPSVRIAHQGVSRYQGDGAHIEAVALEVSGSLGGATSLLSPERRDYVDTRESPIGATVARPAVMRASLEDLRVAIDSIAPDESVSIRVTSVPFAFAWRAVALFALVGILLALIPARAAAPDGASHPVTLSA